MRGKSRCIFVMAVILAWCPRAYDVRAQSVTPQRAKTIFVEYGGTSDLLSVNFDTRFKPQRNGWGVRAGAGYLPNGRQHRFSIPVQLNYLLGKKQHFFEAAAGATFYHTNFEGSTWGIESNVGGSVFATLSAGYRYQPIRRGLSARIGASGFWGSFLPVIIPGVSLGYVF